MDNPINEYMTVQTAAMRLKVSDKAIYKHIANEHLESEEHLGKIVIHKDALQIFIWSKHYRGRAREGEQDGK